MSSLLTSSHPHSHSSSIPPQTPTPPPPPPPPPTTQPSSSSSSPSTSFYLPTPTSLALTASGFLRRFYTEPTTPSKPAPAAAPSQDSHSFNGAYTPPHRHASPFQPPPLSPLVLNGLPTDTSSPNAQLLSRSIAEEIRSLIPPRLQLADGWELAYSLERDGVSLATLYERCERYGGAASARRRTTAFVLVVKDGYGGLFGAYLTDTPHPSPHYYGTGECFLWRASVVVSSTPQLLASSLPPPPSASEGSNLVRATTIVNTGNNRNTLYPPPPPPPAAQPSSSFCTSKSNGGPTETGTGTGTSTPTEERIRFKAFPYSGVNDYLIFCEPKYLSVGGGDGHYGLWLDDAFERGISSPCPTFGNERLSDEGDRFEVLGVEVWCVGGGGS
ncbi:MAG: oxidation resistance protein 1 [Peltula sp. TS41687]|nr:MAG: oxidation resistance protein 1 [Peltula sp. TS41687]